MFQPTLPIDLEPFSNSNIRSRLIGAIGIALGRYEPTVPAIYFVINPTTDPPKNYRTDGLECLIFSPIPQSARPLQHNAAINEVWELRLIQHDRTKSTLPAYRAILAKYPDIYLDSHIPANRDTNEQLNLSIVQVAIIQ